MRKINYFILATLFALFSISSIIADNPPLRIPVIINGTVSSNPGGGYGSLRPRSEVAAVEAWYDTATSMLEVAFNEEIGNATVTVLNSANQCVAECTCNTAVEQVVFTMFVAAEGETYTVYVTSDSYEGVGYLYAE